jgi:hypothetical protein
MKTHEIISKTNVDEGLGSWLLGKAGQLVSKAGGGFANKIMSKSDFIEHEAGVLVNLARSRGISVADAVHVNDASKARAVQRYITDALEDATAAGAPRPNMTALKAEAETAIGIHPLSKDPGVRKKILNAAEAEHGKAILGAVGKLGSAAWTAGLGGLKAWGVYELWVPPLKDYWENMATARSYLDSGQWNESNYRNEENKQLSTLIGRLGVGLATVGVARLLNNELTRALLGKTFGGVLDLSTTAAVIWLRTKLNEDEWADGIASIMMNDYIAGNATVMGQAIPGIGSVAAEAKRKLLGDIKANPVAAAGAKDKPVATTDKPAGDATQNTKPTEKKPETDGKQTTPADTTPKVDPDATPRDKWINLGAGYIKDPKTGEIKRSVDRQFQ